MTNDDILAPFTPDEVEALNRWQQYGPGHPFTCPRSHGGTNVALIARTDAWHCSDPACGFTQDWAHPLMANPAAWPKPFPRGVTVLESPDPAPGAEAAADADLDRRIRAVRAIPIGDVHSTAEPYAYRRPTPAAVISHQTVALTGDLTPEQADWWRQMLERLPEAPPAGQDASFPGPFQVWPLERILRDVAVGSGDWTWDEEWADLDRRHAETGYLNTLEQQIRDNGITMPVLIGNDGRLWDGHHRLRIAVRLGIGYVPVEVAPTEPTAPTAGPRRCGWAWGLCTGCPSCTLQAVAGPAETIARLRAERDQYAAGIPLICSSERHQAKVAGLEARLARVSALADQLDHVSDGAVRVPDRKLYADLAGVIRTALSPEPTPDTRLGCDLGCDNGDPCPNCKETQQ
jgi:hypothetical protein